MTEKQYQDYLSMIEISAPDYILLEDLQAGFSPINVMYMSSAIEELADKLSWTKKDADKSHRLAKNTDLRSQQILRSDLFIQRAKLSNSFHKVTTDQERAAISKAIKNVQDNIKQSFADEQSIKTIGIKKDELDNIKSFDFDIPTDPIKLVNKRNSLRVMISRQKTKILNLARLPADHKDKSKIEKVEAALNKNKLYLKHVEHAIKHKDI